MPECKLRKWRRAAPGGDGSDEDELSKVLPLWQLQEEIQRDSAIVHVLQNSWPESQRKPKVDAHLDTRTVLWAYHVDVELIEASEGRLGDFPQREHEANRREGAFAPGQGPHVARTVVLSARRRHLYVCQNRLVCYLCLCTLQLPDCYAESLGWCLEMIICAVEPGVTPVVTRIPFKLHIITFIGVLYNTTSIKELNESISIT